MPVIITGDKKLLRILKNIPAKSAKKAIRKASRQSAKIIQRRAKKLAPRRSGKRDKAGNAQHIRNNIRVRAMKRSRVRIGAIVMLAVQSGARHAAFVALGTKKMAERRFLRKAVSEKKRAVRSIFFATLGRIIRTEAKRG